MLSVDEICDLLSKVKGVNPAMLEQYETCIHDNNVCGLVLATCDIGDLGKVVEMKFGDWQLFKSAILSMRKIEDVLNDFEEKQLQEMSSSREVSPNFEPNTNDVDLIDGAAARTASSVTLPEGDRKKSILVPAGSTKRKGQTGKFAMERKSLFRYRMM